MSMSTVAVLGASGFIGSRFVEVMNRDRHLTVRPVVRTESHLSLLPENALDSRIADARNQKLLVSTFSGCDAVIHATSGSPESILAAVEPAYRAAHIAGVRRFVYLSSASVHGQAPEPGANEETPLSDNQSIGYNNAKVRAERMLQRLRDECDVEIVILRPGIVVGPRSSWIKNFADALLVGEAWLPDDDSGICNSIQIDNLIHAIRLALTADGVDRQAFLVGDREEVKWRDLYQPVVQALGRKLEDVPRISPVFSPESDDTSGKVPSVGLLRALMSAVPGRIRVAVGKGVSSVRLRRSKPTVRTTSKYPRASLEMNLLYSCRFKFPNDKAKRLLGYDPPISFDDGSRRTIDWSR
jgi:nucleoside-diphosphate-sugar epimerase